MSEEKNYSADSIQALEGMEHVRMRPSMYIGDVGSRGTRSGSKKTRYVHWFYWPSGASPSCI